MTHLQNTEFQKELHSSHSDKLDIAGGVGIATAPVVGVVAFGVILGYSIYRGNHLPQIERTFTDRFGQTITHMVTAPEYKGQEVLWILSATLGSIFGSPLIGAVSGFSTFGLGYLALSPYRQAEERLLKTYRSDAPLPPEEIASCCAYLTHDSLMRLAPKMSFEQLNGLRVGLGMATFSRYIDDKFPDPAQRYWSWLLKLPSRTDYQQIHAELDSIDLKKALQDPLFFAAYQELSPLPQKKWCYWISPSKSSEEVTLKLDQGELRVKKDLLTQNLGYFRYLLEEREAEEPLPVEWADRLPLLISLLEGQTDLTPQVCRDLLPLADFLSADRLMSSIEAYIMSHPADFSKAERYSLAPQFPNLPRVLQEELKARNIMITNWAKEAEFIEAHKLTDYQQHLAHEITTKLSDQTSSPDDLVYWLKASSEISPESHERNLRLITLTDERLPALYQYALDTESLSLKQRILTYCQDNASQLQSHWPWPTPMPNEVANILFPNEAPFPHQKDW
ncbi:MAG: hypothetical protein AB7F31_07715 [Parachlamydiales bacterium]